MHSKKSGSNGAVPKNIFYSMYLFDFSSCEFTGKELKVSLSLNNELHFSFFYYSSFFSPKILDSSKEKKMKAKCAQRKQKRKPKRKRNEHPLTVCSHSSGNSEICSFCVLS